MNKLGTLVGSLLLSGCATGGYNPAYFYNEVQVYNRSGGEIEDVRVQFGETGRSLYCDRVNENALCDDRFGKRRFPGTTIELSWTHPDGSDRNESLSPDVPIYFVSGIPLRVMLEISANGNVRAFFEQDEPGRDGGGGIFIGG